MKEKPLNYYWHPFLIGLFPVLFLFAHNIFYIPASDVLIPAALVVLFTAIGLGLGRLIFRSWVKAALLVSFGWILFFNFRAFFDLLKATPLQFLHQYSIFFLLNTVLYLIVAVLLFRYPKSLRRFNKVLNVFGLILILLPLSQILIFYLQESKYQPGATEAETAAWQSNILPENRPDIVYMMLDGYGRQDILKKYYNLDNQPFIDFLEQEGFYIAPKSLTNYNRTALSAASSLNLNYIQHLQPNIKEQCYTNLEELLENAALLKFLKNQDYNLYSFASGFSHTELTQNATFITRQNYISEFYGLLLSQTPLLLLEENAFLFDKYNQLQVSLFKYPNELSRFRQHHRDRILFALEDIPEYVGKARPSFLFADIFVGHPPFIFDADGNYTEPVSAVPAADGNEFMKKTAGGREAYVKGLREQTIYLNKKIAETVRQIKQNSTRPTIIILQGDHGPGSFYHQEDVNQTDLAERYPILNAILLPGSEQILPPDLTPVNSFRYILNKYFGTRLPILPNRHYFSPGSKPCRFMEVTNTIQNGISLKKSDIQVSFFKAFYLNSNNHTNGYS